MANSELPVEHVEGRPIHLGKQPYAFALEEVSTLNIGGWDPNDLTGDIYWYDTSDCPGGWNMTATNIWIGDESILPNSTLGGPEVQL